MWRSWKPVTVQVAEVKFRGGCRYVLYPKEEFKEGRAELFSVVHSSLDSRKRASSV